MRTPPLVIMGVSGSGKTTVAEAVARRIESGEALDADDLHPASNVEKMRAGHPLTDEDRAPWLDAVGRAMRASTDRGRVPVMACSALRRAYRERVLAGEPDALFVLLDVDRPELERRLRERRGHYMPASLLDSQLDTLERFDADEPGVAVRIVGPAQDVDERVLAAVHPAG